MAVADGRMRLSERVEIPDSEGWQPPAGWQPMAEGALYNFSAHTSYFQTMGQYDIPRFLEGGLTAQALAIYIDDLNLDRALQRALDMVYWLNREAEESPDFDLITRVADIHRIKPEGKTGGFLAFEGFEPLGANLKLLDVFFRLGLRLASLTHSRRNPFADGTQHGIASGGLSKLGKQAVQRMNELGIVIDLAHLNQPGCWEVLALSEAPVVLSHTSPRRYFPAKPTESPLYPSIVGDRARALMDAIAEKGGVIGIIAWNQADLDTFLDDLDYAVQAVGPDHVALGTDFYGFDQAPDGFADIGQLPNVTRRLVERGYADDAILKILGGNYLRVFEQVWV
jgi:membrane dipeptidase